MSSEKKNQVKVETECPVRKKFQIPVKVKNECLGR